MNFFLFIYVLIVIGAKVIKKLVKILIIILLGLFAIPSTAFILLQNRKIQSYLANEIAKQVSENLKAEFSIESVDIIFFNRVILNHVLLKDQASDTLLYANRITATTKKFNLSAKRLYLSKIKLEHSLIRIAIDSEQVANIQYLIQGIRERPDTSRSKWDFSVRNIEVKDSRFKLENPYNPSDVSHGINFSDLSLNKLDLDLRDLILASDTVKFSVTHANFQEKTGFIAEDFAADFTIHKQLLDFSNVRIKNKQSRVFANQVHFEFRDYEDFREEGIWNKVKVKLDFADSHLDVHDLGYFSERFYGVQEEVDLSGRLYGKFNNLKGRNVRINYHNYLTFSGDFDLNGMPDYHQTYMFFDFQNLTADIGLIKTYGIPGLSDTLEISDNILKLGKIYYRGKFIGFINDFVSYGKLITDLGQVSTDISIQPVQGDQTSFHGQLKTVGFDLGELAGIPETLGAISMNAKVSGISSPGGQIQADMDGKISSLFLNNYDYQNIFLIGELSNNTFDGSFAVEDPNLKMEFYGKIDASDTLPVFDFTANVDKAKLFPLNISKADPDYTLSCYLNANFTGTNLDDFDGEINLVNSLFQRPDKQIQIYDFNLLANHRPDSNRMVLKSDFLDAEIIGLYDFNSIGKAFGRIVENHFPALRIEESEFFDTTFYGLNHFNFNIHFKNTFPITDFFLPEIQIARDSKVSGEYNPGDYRLKILCDFPELDYKNNHWSELSMSLLSNDTATRLNVNLNSFNLGEKITFNKLDIESESSKNKTLLDIEWDDPDMKIFSGRISGEVYLEARDDQRPVIYWNMLPRSIIIRDTVWDIQASRGTIDSTSISINNFKIVHNNQFFNLDGIISELPDDILTLTSHTLNLENFNVITNRFGLEISGILDGNTVLSNLYNNPLFISNFTIKELAINDEILGDTKIQTNWINKDQKIKMTASSFRGNLETLHLDGDYKPASTELDLDFILDKLRLNIVYPYLDEYLEELSGIISGDMRLHGTVSKPLLEGKIKLQKVGFLVTYLQTRYNFSNEIQIKKNNIRFKDFDLYDEQGSVAYLNGNINSKDLRDLTMDLTLNMDNFYLLNTREINNTLYYGRAIGTGIVQLKRESGNIDMNISVRTEDDTELNINMNEGKEISESNFIVFVNSGETLPEEIQYRNGNGDNHKTIGLNMSFDLEINPLAEVQIIFDPQVGDIMKGNGYGNIRLELNPVGEFKMYGSYQIEEGEYLFTLQNIINKRLKVQKGGSISWNGDPMDAVIDMRAVYSTKATPAILVPEGPEYLNKRYPVDCHLLMTDKMMNPTIQFEIILPSAEEETKNFVKNAITTDEELTKQFLSLLVINNFSTPQINAGTASSGGVSMAGVTTSELLSNQLSNWLSQISNDFDIGVNYRPGDDITSDQVEVALSTQILDDRVSIHTNLDVGGTQAAGTNEGTNTSNIAGEFDVNVKLTDDGKFSIKAYNHSNDDQLYKSSLYTQGVGFVYREDFNTFGELSRRFWRMLTGANKKGDEKKKKAGGESGETSGGQSVR